MNRTKNKESDTKLYCSKVDEVLRRSSDLMQVAGPYFNMQDVLSKYLGDQSNDSLVVNSKVEQNLSL